MWLRTVVGPLVVMALGREPSLARAQTPDTTTLRPADVSLTVSNSPRYSGTYRATGVARICGKVDLGYPHRANAFTVEFPDDEPDLPVRALSFDADTLKLGTTIISFYLSVGVTTPTGGTPPHFVVRANRPQYGEKGTAKLTAKAGTATLDVTGTNDMGVGLAVSVICHPKPRAARGDPPHIASRPRGGTPIAGPRSAISFPGQFAPGTNREADPCPHPSGRSV